MLHIRRTILGFFAVALITAHAPTADAAESASDTPAKKPNILLIVSDDQGYGDAGCYGSGDVQTPVLDRLAERGIRFTQFRATPLCGPTRASLLTGQHSIETGMWRGPANPGRNSNSTARRLHADLTLLPQYLKRAGYATGCFGKWHLGYEPPNVPNTRGFDEFVGFLGGAHPYEPGRGSPILRNGQAFQDDRHLTDLFTEEAISFLREHREEPFFCYVPYNAVHGPLWNESRPRPSGKEKWLAKNENRGIDFPRRDYNAILEHMDHSIGRLLATLDDLDLADETLVLFFSDNGALIEKYPGDNGPLRGEKSTTYEGGIRVPAIARWPGVIPSGCVSDEPAAVFDLFATCLDAAGLSVPKTNGRYPVHGVSLLPHLKSGGKQPLPDRYLFWDLWGKLAAYHGGWKLVGVIENHHGRFAEAVPDIEALKFELYHLPDDIAEQNDLADARPEIHADLKSRLIDWFTRSTTWAQSE